MERINFKPGGDFDWSGDITLEGVSDFTGYTVASEIRVRDSQGNPVAGAPLSTATVTWLDAAAGIFRLLVPGASTESWPSSGKLLIDIKITSPGGGIVYSDTATIVITPKVTA